MGQRFAFLRTKKLRTTILVTLTKPFSWFNVTTLF